MPKYRIKTEARYDGAPKFITQMKILWFWWGCDSNYSLEHAEENVKNYIAKDNFKSEIIKEYN